MRIRLTIFLLPLLLLMEGCRIIQTPSVDGSIISGSGQYDCSAGDMCTIDIDAGSVFSDSFTAVPNSGFNFSGWGGTGCAAENNPCNLFVPADLTIYNIDANLKPVFVPDAFTAEWLTGKIFYVVWFGSGEDANGNELDNVAAMDKFEIGADNTITVTALVNTGENGTFTYTATNGMIREISEPEGSGTVIVCGSTKDYIKTHYMENGVFDNVDLLFYDESTARKFLSTLTESIPPSC